MDHKYSVILCTLAPDGGNVWKNPREVLEPIAEAGYDGIDMDAEPDLISEKQFKEVSDLAHSMGLKVPAIVGAWALWHAGEERDLASPDPAVRATAVSYATKCVDLAATFEEPPFFEIVPCPAQSEYPRTKVPYNTLRDGFLDSTEQIAKYAKERGVNIAIEPVNRFEAYAGFMNTIPEVMDVIESVGMDNVYALADFFHVSMEDGPITDTLRCAGDRLVHIHLADSNRQSPGTGHIDFLDVIRTLNDIEFTGYMALDSVPCLPDWRTLVKETLPFMKQMERTVALGDKIAAKTN
jgi:sugar phosphate isomerase/epimerase